MARCLSFFTGIQLPDAMISLWELLFTCPYLRSFVPLLGFCLGNLFNDLSGYLLGPIYIFLPGHIFLVHFHNLKKTSLLTLAFKKGKTRKKKREHKNNACYCWTCNESPEYAASSICAFVLQLQIRLTLHCGNACCICWCVDLCRKKYCAPLKSLASK